MNWKFKHIYCINLEKRKDRWKESKKQFDKYNIQVERINAEEGREEKNKLSKGEVGLIQSYKKVLKDAITKEYESIVIFEDDVLFVEEFNERFESCMKQIPDDWEIIQFGGLNYYKNFNKIKENIYKPNQFTLTTHAIAIKQSIYKDIIESIKDYEDRLDKCIANNYHRYKSYGIYPSLILQRRSFSDILEMEMDYGKAILQSEKEIERII